MEQGKVFISSILNRSLEDLTAERNIARQVIESYDFLKPWAFEVAPASFEDLDESYLRNVDDSDIFIVIVGAQATNPVAAEIQRARQRNKPILAFAKRVPSRTPIAQALLESAGTKYAAFDSPEALRASLRDALNHMIVMGLHSLATRSKTPFGQLRHLVERKARVHIKPTIPRFAERDMFSIRELANDVLTVEKESTDEELSIPVSRISDTLFHDSKGETPVLVLDGRLQWLSMIQRWRFFPEKPGADSPLGFSKPSGTSDPSVARLCAELQRKGYTMGWAAEVEIPGKQNGAFQVVYDDDGHYFKIADRVRDLALVAQTPQAATYR
jgi:hypothetical protein